MQQAHEQHAKQQWQSLQPIKQQQRARNARAAAAAEGSRGSGGIPGRRLVTAGSCERAECAVAGTPAVGPPDCQLDPGWPGKLLLCLLGELFAATAVLSGRQLAGCCLQLVCYDPWCSKHLVLTPAPLLAHVSPLAIPLQWALALPALVVSGASDWADGWAARRFNQPSVIGSYLDPLADKVLICSVVGALGWSVSAGGWRAVAPWMRLAPTPRACGPQAVPAVCVGRCPQGTASRWLLSITSLPPALHSMPLSAPPSTHRV